VKENAKHKELTVTPSAHRLLYDRKGAAQQLSISVRSLDYLIAAKQFDTRRIGKKVLVPYASLVQYASANHYDSPNPKKPTVGSAFTATATATIAA
jgi:hypothetical protein